MGDERNGQSEDVDVFFLRSGVYLDSEFDRRGPRVGFMTALTFAALVMVIAFVLWARAQH